MRRGWPSTAPSSGWRRLLACRRRSNVQTHLAQADLVVAIEGEQAPDEGREIVQRRRPVRVRLLLIVQGALSFAQPVKDIDIAMRCHVHVLPAHLVKLANDVERSIAKAGLAIALPQQSEKKGHAAAQFSGAL